jgi:hypothetical protein
MVLEDGGHTQIRGSCLLRRRIPSSGERSGDLSGRRIDVLLPRELRRDGFVFLSRSADRRGPVLLRREYESGVEHSRAAARYKWPHGCARYRQLFYNSRRC